MVLNDEIEDTEVWEGPGSTASGPTEHVSSTPQVSGDLRSVRKDQLVNGRSYREL